MNREDTTVGVLMGGLSAEREISMTSGRAVAGALRRRGWKTVEIDVGRDLPAQLVAQGVDVCWIALHGRFGEDGCVQGLLEVMGIPFTGCGVRASAVCMDKIATKRALAGMEAVVMAGDAVHRVGDPLPTLSLPAVCKPNLGGSTIGMTLCRNQEELQAGLEEAHRLDPEVLVEEFVAGDEITVAVLDGEPLPVVAIRPESGFFDFEAKYTKGRTEYLVPAPIERNTWDAAQRSAKVAYDALGCRGLCRADFIVRADGVPVFLEPSLIHI